MRILMFGDSITYRNNWRAALGCEIINRGIDGDTTSGMLGRMGRIVMDDVDVVSLMAGINDIALGESAEAIYDRYGVIAENFAAYPVRMIITSTLHVSDEFYGYEAINDEVRRVNQLLETMADEERYVYIDLNSALTINNALDRSYTTDGVHLNQKAYDVWANLLRKELNT